MSVSALLGACAGNDMPKVELPEIDTNNPLLAEWDTPHATPPFDKIKIEHYEPAIETAIAVSRAEIDAIVNNPAKPTFKNTIVALERQGALLSRIMGVFYNLREADTSDEMDAIALRIQPKLTELSNDVSLNPQLFERVKAVYDGRDAAGLGEQEQRLTKKIYDDFVRSGALLLAEDKEALKQINEELSLLGVQFGRNLLAETNAYQLFVEKDRLKGVPPAAMEAASAEAKAAAISLHCRSQVCCHF